MSVLAIIALTSITIAALLGMLITMIRITASQEQAARDARAADGAATAAVNHLRMNQDDNTDPCAGVGAQPAAGMQVPFQDVGTSTDVQVTCRKAADEFGEPGGVLHVLGSDYAGRLNWAGWPWAGVPVSVAGATPSLVASGSDALQFNGNVNAAAGAAPLRTDTGGTPAVEVRGKYTQGAAGLGASSGCGVLDGAAVRPATAVVASAGASCGDPSLLPVALTQDYAIDESVPAELPLPAACPSQRVIRFSPGRYDQTAVATLNSWFSRTGGCSNKTFHFEQGRYWFDANTASAAAGDRHALIFDNPTSSFVFGTSSGWSTDPVTGGAMSTDFPNACLAGSTADTGASIILSARTELRHLSGRLAVCPYTSPTGTQYPTLLQQSTVPTAITVSNPQAITAVTNVAGLIGNNSANPALATLSCVINISSGKCTAQASFSVQLSGAASATSASTRLTLTGSEQNPVTLIESRKVSFTVTPASGAACTTSEFSGLPNSGRTTTYELQSGGCAGLTAPDAFNGATVRANLTYVFRGGCFIGCPTATERLRIWNAGASAGVMYARGEASGVTQARADDWTDPAAVAVDDAAAAAMQRVVCVDLPRSFLGIALNERWCDYYRPAADPQERSFTLSGIEPTSGADDDHLSSLSVLVRYVRTGSVSNRADRTTVSLRLEAANGVVCTGSVTGLANYSSDVELPLPGCTLAKIGDLRDARLTVSTRPECDWEYTSWFIGGVFVPAQNRCGGPEQPQPQSVALMYTTDTYTGPVVQSRLTIDAANGTSANFFGPAYLKRTALDLHWNGAASGASIFGGEVQLHSLGSVAAVGATTDVVCCTAPEIATRKVRVTSWIDGRPKLTVVAALDRVGGLPSILDWTVCGRNGTCANP